MPAARSLRIVLGFLVIGCIFAVVTAVSNAPGGAETMSAPRMINTLFVGDSFPAGSGVQDRNVAYPEILAAATGMHAEFDAQGGTGFVNAGPGSPYGSTSRLADRVDGTASAFRDVDLLIVDAGRNDLGWPVDDVAAAASDYLARARQHWPDAQIVVIVPTFIGANQRAEYERLEQRLEAAAHSVGGIAIDPIAEGWYDDVQPRGLLDPDGVHPNAQGHALIAERLEHSLRSHGVRLS